MTCKLEEIFNRQAEFVKSLAPIYLRNDFPAHADEMPWRLDSRPYQEEFRLLAWRCTEEVIEAIEEYAASSFGQIEKFHEEIADAFHFFVELCLATGVTPDEVLDGLPMVAEDWTPGSCRLSHSFRFCGTAPGDGIDTRWYCFVHLLGKAMFRFRQRPWRTDDRKTDRAAFVSDLSAAYFSFITACKRSGLNADSLYAAYFAKSKINDQRTSEQKL